MLQIIYTSAAAVPFSPEQLIGLLRKARTKNAALGITGLLLYHDGSFIQVLEGPDGPVTSLVETIQSDPRHRNVKLLLRREIARSNFDEWSMGFVNTAEHDFGSLPGYLDYLSDLSAVDELWDTDRLWWALDRFRQGKLRQVVSSAA